MRITRRKFFQVSLLSSFSLYPSSQGKNERLLRKRFPFQPTITNYNETGRGIIIEGKTLLIAIALDAEAEMVEGSLPVELLPSGNERLSRNRFSSIRQVTDASFVPSSPRRSMP
jgi:hypothetical protein